MLAVMGAMDVETELLLERLEQRSSQTRFGFTVHRGRLLGHELLVATCGIGKVNAALLTLVLASEGADRLVFTGVAGALAPGLGPGDVVVSSDCLQHDVDVTALGYEAGHIPGEPASWSADPELQELALQASHDLPGLQVRLGRVLSGDSFVASADKVRELRERFGGSCVEMEGAAVAQACSRAGLRFVIVRSISDSADGTAKPDFREFTELAARNSLAVVEGLLRRL